MIRILRKLLQLKRYYGTFLNRNFREFYFANKNFWKEQGNFDPSVSGVIISEASVGEGYWQCVVASTAAAVASAYHSRVIYLLKSESQKQNNYSWVQKSFTECEFVSIEALTSALNETIAINARELYDQISKPEDILNIKYGELFIGEQVYDAVMKYKTASVWKLDETVYLEILNAISTCEAIKKLLSEYDVKAGMFTHTTCTYTGVAVRALLKHGKPVYQGVGGFKALKKYNGFHDEKQRLKVHVHIPIELFEDLSSNNTNLRSEAIEYLDKRFGGKIDDWDAMRAFSPDKKVYANKEEFCNDFHLNPSKPCVFIMLHAMNDDPHVHPQEIFKDYFHWFIETLKITKKIDTVNWIYKQHPMIKFYPDDANLKSIFELVDQKNIIYVDEDVPLNSASIPNVAHATITCAGTAGLEYACFGVPGIIACKNHYSDYGICHEPATYDAYRDTLKNINTIPGVPEEMQLKAKVLFYLMYGKLIPGYTNGLLPYMAFEDMKKMNPEKVYQAFKKAFSMENMPGHKVNLQKLKGFVKSGNSSVNESIFLNIEKND